MKLFGRNITIDPVIPFGVGVTIAMLALWALPAKAEGVAKAKPKQAQSQNIFADAPLAPARSWTGCGVGVQGGGLIATVAPSGSPIAVASDTAAIGVNANCAMQAGILVFGLEVGHDWFNGNLKDLGVQRNVSVTGTLGVLPVSNTQLYLHAGFTQLGVDKAVFGVNNIDGWSGGAGIKIELPTEMPLFWDNRYIYSVYDIKDLAGPGIDANSHSLRTGLTMQFQMFR